jgi:Bax protein
MTKSKGKILRIISFILVALLTTFIVGTFYPNPYTKYQIEKDVEIKYTLWANDLGLHEPAFEYQNDVQFVEAVRKCVDWVNFETPRFERVPTEMIVAMAALESGWGTSRFAIEGNNLFGIRTYDKEVPHMLLEGRTKWKGWGVRKFKTKCQGVKFFVELLNNHYAYEEFRKLRDRKIAFNQTLDSIELVETLKAYSTTTDYANRVVYIIKSIRDREEKIADIQIKVKEDSHVIPKKKP